MRVFLSRYLNLSIAHVKYLPGLQVTLHQGAIESIFLDSMQSKGHIVHRPIKPTALEISEDEEALKDPHAYVVKVCSFDV